MAPKHFSLDKTKAFHLESNSLCSIGAIIIKKQIKSKDLKGGGLHWR